MQKERGISKPRSKTCPDQFLLQPYISGFTPNYVILFQTQQEYSNSSQPRDKWEVAENMNKEIEAFTCNMYGYSKETSVKVVRSKILKKMVGEDNDLIKESKVDLSHLPPARTHFFHTYTELTIR